MRAWRAILWLKIAEQAIKRHGLKTFPPSDADAPLRVVREDGSLTDEDLLPGFTLPLTSILPAPGGYAVAAG